MAAKLQTTYSQNFVPSWYTGYGQDILADQAAVADRPYEPYTGERIAGFTPDQEAGFGMTRDAATGYQPTLDAAVDAASGIAGRSGLGAAQGALNAASDQSGLAPAYGALGSAANYAAASANPMAINMAQPYLSSAANMSAAGAAAPGMAAGAGLTMGSTEATGINMAQPYLDAAGRSAAAGVGNFMNPYLENVVNRYGDIGARTLREQLMPAIQNKYIQAGQLGGPTRAGTGATGAPSGMMTDAARALRDVQEGVANQQQTALSQGYTQALDASQNEQARYGTLASTAGGLGQNQQGIVANAGKTMADIGQGYGALTGQDQAAQINIGKISGDLGATQQGALATAGNAMAGLGNQYADISRGQQDVNLSIANQTGNLYNADTGYLNTAANTLGGLAQQQQTQGLAGANAVTGVGAQGQALEQAGLDVNYQNSLRAAGYDQAQIDAMTRTYGAVQGGVPTGSVSVQSNKGPNSSLLGTVAGAGLTLAGSTAARP